MKKNLFLIAGGILITVLTGCPGTETSQSNERSNQAHPSKKDSPTHRLHLNQEQKWAANTATTKGIKNMQQLISQQHIPSDTSGFRLLGEALKAELDQIIQKCSMTGRGHQQLHIYLKPLAKHIQGLKKGTIKERNRHYSEIKKHLKTYFRYFE